MLVLTVQRYERIKQMYSKEGYTPDFTKSRYAFLSPNHTRGYGKILKELSRKTGKAFRYGVDSCMWGWVKSPYLKFFPTNEGKSEDDTLYALVVEVPDEELVLSDYDKFCDYIDGGVHTEFIINDIRDADCVQCSFWNIDTSKVQAIINLDMLRGTKMSDILLSANNSSNRELFRLVG